MDIALLRRPIEQRITAATGLHATLGRIDVSAFGATLEIGDVSLTAPDAPPGREPVVAVGRVKVELSLRKAFRGELRIKSIAIERPVVTLHRDAEGGLSLPIRRKAAAADAKGDVKNDGATGERDRRGLIVTIDRGVVVDGEVHFRDASATSTAAGTYHLAATGISAEVTREGEEYRISAFADRLGRRDAADEAARERTNLGRLRLTLALHRATNLAELDEASLDASVVVGDDAAPTLDMQASCARFLEQAVSFSVTAAIEAVTLTGLLPHTPASLRSAAGHLSVRARGYAGVGTPLRVDELAITASDLHL